MKTSSERQHPLSFQFPGSVMWLGRWCSFVSLEETIRCKYARPYSAVPDREGAHCTCACLFLGWLEGFVFELSFFFVLSWPSLWIPRHCFRWTAPNRGSRVLQCSFTRQLGSLWTPLHFWKNVLGFVHFPEWLLCLLRDWTKDWIPIAFLSPHSIPPGHFRLQVAAQSCLIPLSHICVALENFQSSFTLKKKILFDLVTGAITSSPISQLRKWNSESRLGWFVDMCVLGGSRTSTPHCSHVSWCGILLPTAFVLLLEARRKTKSPLVFDIIEDWGR